MSTLVIPYFSRTCFRPCWDYIDAYDYMNMIEGLGLHHLTKKTKPNAYYYYLNPLSLNAKAFSFMNLSKEPLSLKEKQVSLP